MAPECKNSPSIPLPNILTLVYTLLQEENASKWISPAPTETIGSFNFAIWPGVNAKWELTVLPKTLKHLAAK